VHSVGGLPVFVLGNVALILAGRSMATRELQSVRRAALTLGVLGLLGLVLMVVAVARPGWGVGAAERLAVSPLQVWALIGLHHLRPARWTIRAPTELS
jgi:hypothetical membrane protein